VLDPILEQYIEKHRSPEEIVKSGLPKEAVDATVKLVEKAEYKRWQAAPGLKVTSKSFGIGRRYPVARKI
jgi:NH3-dependent NAD+ synthetase